MPELNADDVMSAAVELAGSDDFGPHDFVEGLTVLCAAVDDAGAAERASAISRWSRT